MSASPFRLASSEPVAEPTANPPHTYRVLYIDTDGPTSLKQVVFQHHAYSSLDDAWKEIQSQRPWGFDYTLLVAIENLSLRHALPVPF